MIWANTEKNAEFTPINGDIGDIKNLTEGHRRTESESVENLRANGKCQISLIISIFDTRLLFFHEEIRMTSTIEESSIKCRRYIFKLCNAHNLFN